MAEKVSSDNGEDGKKLTPEVGYVSPEEAERLRKQKAEDEKKNKGHKPKKPLGQRKDPWGDKGIRSICVLCVCLCTCHRLVFFFFRRGGGRGWPAQPSSRRVGEDFFFYLKHR